MKKINLSLCALHCFVGFGALAGGLAAITNPSTPLGISTDMLKNGPFDNFLIPGLILFIVIGLGNIVTAFLFRFKLKYQSYISGINGCILMGFIFIQCIILQTIISLHIIFFLIGLLIALLAFIIALISRLFPFNLILNNE